VAVKEDGHAVSVCFCARRSEKAAEAGLETAEAYRGRGFGPQVTVAWALAVRADTGLAEDIHNLVAATVAELGGVDILINNAVNSTAAPFMELADEDWLNHINVKIMGYVRCARECIPHMRRRGGGRLINIGGMAARYSNPLTNSHGVTNPPVSLSLLPGGPAHLRATPSTTASVTISIPASSMARTEACCSFV